LKDIFSKIWFWFIMLILFLALIMYDRDFEKEVKTNYQKAKMQLSKVHFSEIDQTFEHARVFAEEVEMDESQNNMLASRVRSIFFDKEVATRTAELVASSASKNPLEVVFWGDVKFKTSENERLRTEELRYAINRKELYTTLPVTIWKDEIVITGKDLRYNTQTKEGSLARDVLIRIWKTASSTAKVEKKPKIVRELENASPPSDIENMFEAFPASGDIIPVWNPKATQTERISPGEPKIESR